MSFICQECLQGFVVDAKFTLTVCLSSYGYCEVCNKAATCVDLPSSWFRPTNAGGRARRG